MEQLPKDLGAAGREVGIQWNGRAVAAWVPAPLVERRIRLAEATVRHT